MHNVKAKVQQSTTKEFEVTAATTLEFDTNPEMRKCVPRMRVRGAETSDHQEGLIKEDWVSGCGDSGNSQLESAGGPIPVTGLQFQNPACDCML